MADLINLGASRQCGTRKRTSFWISALFLSCASVQMAAGKKRKSKKKIKKRKRNQIGSLHGGVIGAYYRVAPGDGGYYLDDWAIYDTALTAREIGRLRLRLLAVPLVFRVR